MSGTTNERVVFFGNERLSSSTEPSQTPVLKGLIAEGYEIAAVIVANKPARSRKQRQLEVAEVAKQHAIPIIYVDRPLKKMADPIKALNASVAVLVAFGRIIPQSIINIFEHGIINLHPSDLPQHRGSTPIESTILSGQTETAISIMRLDAGMDTGPVFARQTLQLTGNETKAMLTKQAAEVGAQLLLESLPEIIAGRLQPSEQDHDKATHTQQLRKESGSIDWSLPADVIERQIRAYAGWPGSRTHISDQLAITIHTASVIQETGTAGSLFIYQKSLAIYCGTNALRIDTLQPENKKTMDGVSFINGFKSQLKLTD